MMVTTRQRLEQIIPSGIALALSQLPTILNQGLNSLSNFLITILLINSLGSQQFGSFSIYYLIALQISEVLNALISGPMVSLGSNETEVRRRQIVSASVVLFAFAVLAIGLLTLSLGFASDLAETAFSVGFLATALAGTEFTRRILFLFHRRSAVWTLDILRNCLILVLFGTSAYLSAAPTPHTYVLLMVISQLVSLAIVLIIALPSALPTFTTAGLGARSQQILSNGF